MVRKTLEDLCEDREANGDNLAQKLKSLPGSTIPPELLEGLDQIRLLGNDATHVEFRHFQGVTAAEVEVALGIVREVLKAVYQLRGLVDPLKALKPPSGA